MADSWALPSTEVTASADGSWRLTVYPRGVSSQLAYFQDKVKEQDNAGAPPGEKRTSASGRMEQRVNGKWKTVWEQPLLNEVSPVMVLAVNGGAAVTFDNWHSVGYGNDVVVIYDATGHVVLGLWLEGLPAARVHPGLAAKHQFHELARNADTHSRSAPTDHSCNHPNARRQGRQLSPAAGTLSGCPVRFGNWPTGCGHEQGMDRCHGERQIEERATRSAGGLAKDSLHLAASRTRRRPGARLVQLPRGSFLSP